MRTLNELLVHDERAPEVRHAAIGLDDAQQDCPVLTACARTEGIVR
jgi:hypothetical protein